MTTILSIDVQRRLVDPLLARHPLPWRIEPDWTVEVLDAKDAIVIKCMSLAEAENLIAFATELAEWNADGKRQAEALLRAAGIEP